jgi:hypothetical protein
MNYKRVAEILRKKIRMPRFKSNIALTREELHELFWAHTSTHISDRTLAKACDWNIQSGYWVEYHHKYRGDGRKVCYSLAMSKRDKLKEENTILRQRISSLENELSKVSK